MGTELPEREGQPPSDKAVLSALRQLTDRLGISLKELEDILARERGKSLLTRSCGSCFYNDDRTTIQERRGSPATGGSKGKTSRQKGRALRICGILYPDREWLQWALGKLTVLWGPSYRLVQGFPFDLTDYYRDIGLDLKRAFVSFRGLRSTDALPRWKHEACELENLSGSSRRVNLDPGYVDGARVVLASTKDHSHRIYMGQGVFAEVTMRYSKGKWLYYPHTFPDFKTGRYDAFFSLVKNDWRQAIREEAQLG